MSDSTPAANLSESDLLKLQLALSRVSTAEYALALIKEQTEALKLKISLAYGLGPTDTINTDTGAIVRAETKPKD